MGEDILLSLRKRSMRFRLYGPRRFSFHGLVYNRGKCLEG